MLRAQNARSWVLESSFSSSRSITLINFILCSCFYLDKTFVKMFEIIFWMLQCSTLNSVACICFLTKWICISICLFLAWNLRFLIRAITLWLSKKVRVRFLYFQPRLASNLFSHITYIEAWNKPMYLYSMFDKAIALCFLLVQLTTALARKEYREVDIFMSTFPTQSTS
jgi:pheromone shutdown protein TraB